MKFILKTTDGTAHCLRDRNEYNKIEGLIAGSVDLPYDPAPEYVELTKQGGDRLLVMRDSISYIEELAEELDALT